MRFALTLETPTGMVGTLLRVLVVRALEHVAEHLKVLREVEHAVEHARLRVAAEQLVVAVERRPVRIVASPVDTGM
jgi:hypothetical protein